MKMMQLSSSMLLLTTEALQMKISKDVVIDIKVRSGLRTYQNLEQLAVKLFNDDPDIKTLKGEKYFDEKSWTEEFMNYGCYCNTRVAGGGSVGEDPNDALCNDLYKCYKCINIDYDHTGAYAAEVMTYDAFYNKRSEDIECQNAEHFHDHNGLGECPFNICQCDRRFVKGLLENYKKCITKKDLSKCFNDKWRTNRDSDFDRKQCFDFTHTVVNDQCCGHYPSRIPYSADRLTCCPDNVLRQTGTC